MKKTKQVSMRTLAQVLCQVEGLKVQVNVAQMAEIIGHVSDLLFLDDDLLAQKIYWALVRNGRRRANGGRMLASWRENGG